MTPTEFEQQVERIARALSITDARTIVKWDDRIPDPDNPSQTRQVDISISRDGDLTLVECRLRNRPQDVQWIEELYGRKASLGATTVIAVSSSGFTRGAIAKASRLGVFLRTLTEVDDLEVHSWGKKTKVRVEFVQLSGILFSIIASELISVPLSPASLRTDKHEQFPLGRLLIDVARKLAKSTAPEGGLTTEIFLERTYLGFVPVQEALLTFHWKRLNRDVSLPVFLSYEKIDSAGASRDSLVERNNHNETEIHHAEAGVVATLDFDTLPFAPGCVITGAEIDFGQLTRVRAVEYIEPSPRKELMEYRIQVIRKHGPEYRLLCNQNTKADIAATSSMS